MIIIGVVLLVLVLGALAAVAVSRLDVPGVPDAVDTTSARPLAPGPLRAADVHELRFDQAVRGYRMGQVDEALARLAEELADKDAEIARLRGESDLAQMPAAGSPQHSGAGQAGGGA